LSIPSTARSHIHRSVAKVLAEEAGPANALEIAWHLMRAGDVETAQQFLLLGARQAIDSGAPDIAILALKSASPHLTSETASEEGKILLADAFQEVSCWKDSLDVLRESIFLIKEKASLATVLRIHAEFLCGELSHGQQICRMEELMDLLDSDAPRAAKTRACFILGRLVASAQSELVSARVIEKMNWVSRAGCSPLEQAQVLAGMAMAQFHFRDRAAPEALIDEATHLLQTTGLTSTIGVQLLVGKGAIHAGSGRYDEALRHFQNAFSQSQRLDNIYLQASAANNISMCLCRLGLYPDQLKWVRDTEGLFSRINEDDSRMLFRRHWQTMALTMLGQSSDAMKVIRGVDGRLPFTDSWLCQAWALHRADVYWLLGSRRRAVDSARQGTEGPMSRLQSLSFAGKFARWLATRTTLGEFCNAEERSLELLDEDRLDLFDKAEILGGLLLLRGVSTTESNPGRSRYQLALGGLPAPAVHQLCQLGMPILRPSSLPGLS
jgi:tetratricopeptide (TPR) repeat protein